MKRLFLTSAFNQVGNSVAAFFSEPVCTTVAFITTAADVYETKPWMEADRQTFVDLGFQVADYDIKDTTEERIYSDLKTKDIVFVSGGNTFYLLYHARKSGFDRAIERMLEEGKPYIGSSAGSILVGPTIEPTKPLDNAEQAPKLESFAGLGFVDFVILPHYGAKKYEQRYQAIMEEWSPRVTLLPISDGQLVVVKGSDYRVVGVRP